MVLRRFIPDDGWVGGCFLVFCSLGPCYVPYNDKVKQKIVERGCVPANPLINNTNTKELFLFRRRGGTGGRRRGEGRGHGSSPLVLFTPLNITIVPMKEKNKVKQIENISISINCNCFQGSHPICVLHQMSTKQRKGEGVLPVACAAKEGDHDSESVEESDRGIEYRYGDDNRQHLLHVSYLVKE